MQPWRDSLQLHDKPLWVLRDSRQDEDIDKEEEMDQVQVASIKEKARSKLVVLKRQKRFQGVLKHEGDGAETNMVVKRSCISQASKQHRNSFP